MPTTPVPQPNLKWHKKSSLISQLKTRAWPNSYPRAYPSRSFNLPRVTAPVSFVGFRKPRWRSRRLQLKCLTFPEMGHFMSQVSLSSFIWSVADLLRGDYKQSDYGKVILPFTVLRRLDCVLEPTKEAVLAEFAAKQQDGREPRAVPAPESGPELLQHVADGHAEADRRPGPHPREPVRLRPGVLAIRPRHLRALRLLHPGRAAARRRSCSIKSPRSSRTSTSTRTRSATRRWASSSRS